MSEKQDAVSPIKDFLASPEILTILEVMFYAHGEGEQEALD